MKETFRNFCKNKNLQKNIDLGKLKQYQGQKEGKMRLWRWILCKCEEEEEKQPVGCEKWHIWGGYC